MTPEEREAHDELVKQNAEYDKELSYTYSVIDDKKQQISVLVAKVEVYKELLDKFTRPIVIRKGEEYDI